MNKIKQTPPIFFRQFFCHPQAMLEAVGAANIEHGWTSLYSLWKLRRLHWDWCCWHCCQSRFCMLLAVLLLLSCCCFPLMGGRGFSRVVEYANCLRWIPNCFALLDCIGSADSFCIRIMDINISMCTLAIICTSCAKKCTCAHLLAHAHRFAHDCTQNSSYFFKIARFCVQKCT